MKTVIIPLVILLFLTSVSYAQPTISFDQNTYDLSAVGQVDTLEQLFDFANTGDQELVINRLEAS